MQEFEEIYEQYYQRIYKYALSMCRNQPLAEEITQDTFFKAYKSIDSFKGDCSISSWLCVIAKNTYFSQLKRDKKRNKHAPEPSAGAGFEVHFLEKESAYEVHRVLHRLREPYKEVFWLKTFGELSFREIGDLFGKSENWGRVTYYRAKIMIREEIE